MEAHSALAASPAFAGLTWQQVRERFEAANPALKAAQDSIAESQAGEITAHLRPNPDLSLSADGFAKVREAWRINALILIGAALCVAVLAGLYWGR